MLINRLSDITVKSLNFNTTITSCICFLTDIFLVLSVAFRHFVGLLITVLDNISILNIIFSMNTRKNNAEAVAIIL